MEKALVFDVVLQKPADLLWREKMSYIFFPSR